MVEGNGQNDDSLVGKTMKDMIRVLYFIYLRA